ncbi:MAG TPA: acetate--CoA ligase family protein [Burkholderiaceae bacterium]|nr:acetate--CoA ligase family protein [Burkholderiaceae bacterium]
MQTLLERDSGLSAWIEGRSPSFLHAILNPDSIAIIGASADPTKRGYTAVLGLVEAGYQGRIYPVNPRLDTLLGVPAVATLDDIPEPVDLALICTPATTLPGILADCGRLGVKGAIILAAGFRETGEAGELLEARVLEVARQGNVRIIGPNTSGMFNLHKRVNLLALEAVRPGGVGVVSQSGNMLLALAMEAEHNGFVGFSTYVGPGNQTDVDFTDYLQYLGEDPNTKVAVLYVEGFRNGREFLDVARQITPRKPVVVYKSGSTEVGKKSAASHTGALAGSYEMAVDLLRQAGVSVVHSSDQILPVADGLALLDKAHGRRIAIIADGGGQATIAADRIIEAGLRLAELSQSTRDRLAEVLLPQASLANPVDVAGTSDTNPEVLAQCVEIVAKDESVDAIMLVGMFGGYHIRFDHSLLGAEIRCAASMIAFASQSDVPLVVHSIYAERRPSALQLLRQAGMPVMASIEYGVEVLRTLSERGVFLNRIRQPAPMPAVEPDLSMQAVFRRAIKEGRDLLEFEGKNLLRTHGVQVAHELVVRKPTELQKAIDQFGDEPLVMKVISRDILHKSDAGGVKLNLVGLEALERAYDQIMIGAKQYNPEADIHGVLIAPMARPGVEVIVGVVQDPVFGPVMMVGLGGIFVEVMKDVAFRAIPLTRYDAYGMLEQLKGRQVLEGVRGQPPVDKDALVDLIMKVASIVESYPDIAEVDLNPVILYPDGYAVVDARVITRKDDDALNNDSGTKKDDGIKSDGAPKALLQE